MNATNNMTIIPVLARYTRARVTAYTSGTVNGAAFACPIDLSTPYASIAANASTALMGDVSQGYRNTSTNAAGGAHVVSAATTNATIVKASGGRVIGWSLANTSAAWKFVKLHNVAVAPTPGSGVVMTIAIPPNGKSEFTLEGGRYFATGIGYTITGGAADNDTTAVAVNDVVGDLFYA
jgi:hypothetical protein